MCRCCPSGIASGITRTAARIAALRYAPKSRQSNLLGCVPSVEGFGSSSLSEERRSQKRDASSPEVFTRSAPIREAAFQPAELAGDGGSVVALSFQSDTPPDPKANAVFVLGREQNGVFFTQANDTTQPLQGLSRAAVFSQKVDQDLELFFSSSTQLPRCVSWDRSGSLPKTISTPAHQSTDSLAGVGNIQSVPKRLVSRTPGLGSIAFFQQPSHG
jgi:hypothetical protein